MNIETVITITHFSVSVKQLIGFLRTCIDFPRTCFGQPAPLLHAYYPTSRVFGFPRAYFWAANTSSPRLLPISSSNQLPADLFLGSQYLFSALAAQTASRQTTAEQVLAHSRLKTVAINQQVHLPPTKKSPYGLFFANSFYIRRS